MDHCETGAKLSRGTTEKKVYVQSTWTQEWRGGHRQACGYPESRLSDLVLSLEAIRPLCMLYLWDKSQSFEFLFFYIQNKTMYFHYLAPNVTIYFF